MATYTILIDISQASEPAIAELEKEMQWFIDWLTAFTETELRINRQTLNRTHLLESINNL